MRRWDFKRAPYWDLPDDDIAKSEPSFKAKVRSEQDTFEQLLEDGWEPIGAYQQHWDYARRSHVWLRKPL